MLDDVTIKTLANTCADGVHPQTVIALIHVESSRNPWAININKRPHYITLEKPSNYEDAVRYVRRIDKDVDSIDVGLMQINSRNLKRLNISYADAFNPCRNIQIGTQILRHYYEKAIKVYGEGQKALRKALSAYNTGDFKRGITNGYVNKVLKAAGIKTESKNITTQDINRVIFKYSKADIQNILNAPSSSESNELEEINEDL